MALTTYLNLELLEVGQKDKEITINTNFSSIDSKVIRYLGENIADPSAVGIAPGCTYYNSTNSKLKVLKTDGAWVNVA